MEPTRSKHLLVCHQEITNGMVSMGIVCGHLLSSDALTLPMVESIMAKDTETNQASALNTMIVKQPDLYDKYYRALYDSGNKRPAGLLEKYLSTGVLRISVAPGGGHVGGPATGGAAAPVPGNVVSRVTERAGEQGNEFPNYDFDPRTANVELCDRRDPKVMEAFQSLDRYPMESVPRGEVLIINNVNFNKPELTQRIGSDVDAKGALRVFNQLGFSGRIQNDLSLSRINAAVVAAAERTRKTDSCFICVVLSHGTKDGVCGVDGDTITLLQLTKIVCGNECPNLIGKPKLFFIQACQGDNKDTGVVQPDSGEDHAQWEQLVSEMKAALETTDSDKPIVPTMADLFVAVGSYPGYVSWRNAKTGSWFIDALLSVFKKEAHRYHLLDMMTMVNDHVSKKMCLGPNYKQVSKYESTLRKNMYFFPGLPEDQTSRQ